MLDGKIVRTAKARVIARRQVVHRAASASLRRFKDDVREVAAGFECGIGFEGYTDIKEGDIIEASRSRRWPRISASRS